MKHKAHKRSIAIIGGGPAGCTLANLLAHHGNHVGLFHSQKRLELIVGESLLPSVIPILSKLGVEEEVKSFSTFKPGATIWLGPEEKPSFDFALGKSNLHYAYNTPRDRFDACLLQSARKKGAKIFDFKAKLDQDKSTNKVSLSEDTLVRTDNYFKDGVDLIVDATGRCRLISNLLKLKSEHGDRKDLALFAHWTGVKISDPGNIHVDRYEKGWGWRIPLPGKESLGIVIDPIHLNKYNGSLENKYDHIIREQVGSREFILGAKRISSVVVYTNYQLKTEDYFGDNWALVGDAAGFIDPVFSTGLYLSMNGALRLADAIKKGGSAKNLMKYQVEQQKELLKWQNIIDLWYDGRLFTLFRMGQKYQGKILGKLLIPHMTKHITKIFTGEAGKGNYSGRLLRFMSTYGIRNLDPSDLKIN